jgi:hypothetical protein
MNPSVKAMWLTALRSGKYTQGPSKLKAVRAGKVTHCCLGVLCEIATVVGLVTENQRILPDGCRCGRCNDATSKDYGYIGAQEIDSDPDYGYPPATVREWAGITNEETRFLARMNDNGTPFSAIADEIEGNY